MKGKTREERAALRNAMMAYKAEGHSMPEVAEKFGYSKAYTQIICKGIAPQPSKCKTYRNQYTGSDFDREANAKRYIKERTPDFEYAGNFTGIDGYVDLKCLKCNSIIRKSFVSVRQGKATCPVCIQRRKEERINRERQQKEQRAATRAKSRAEQKADDYRYGTKFKQITFRQCQICGNAFISSSSNAKYCSDKCRNKNRWTMKDGYRYLFPLDEVYERDNGICYICGKACDWNDYTEKNGVIIYGDNYPSRDHVIPKTKGGGNTWDNIRLAHRLCNTRKGNRPRSYA